MLSKLKLLVPLSLLLASNVNAFNWNSTRFVYAFGDSYTFVEGTEGEPLFSFIGSLLNISFTPEQLLADKIVPKNTSSEAANWIEFLTGCFGGHPSDCDIQLWDFAFAGSDISGDLLPLHHNFTTPLVNQVAQWAEFASDVIEHPANETTTFWWIGINDTGDSLNNATITNFTAFFEEEMAAYFNAVQLAFDKGLTQHVFINVPPEDRNPASIGLATTPAYKASIELFNELLLDSTAAFAAQNPSATVINFDANAVFTNVLNNPAEFGFTNITGFCTCTDPAGFFWYNSGHPTQAVHEIVARELRSQLIVASTS